MPSERVQRRIDRLLDQAEEAADEFDWGRVRDASLSVLAVDQDNEDAKSFLAMAEPHMLDDDSTTETESGSVQRGASSSPADVIPISFASGRYEVARFLGEGGKKKVYLAHDTTLDRDVAFAIIKTDGLDDVGRERVRREAQAMGRMGTHPHIMPIYDLGQEAGQPFMVQPVMGGGDVEGLIEDAEGPLELETAIRIAGETCRGLQFAHDKGIVHRDLKPGNVWMDEDGLAKIGDFGLAVATDRSRLTVEKVMVGTVNYMPPEQATGGEVTPKADLYSLGAMLYEMTTGRVPFMGDDEIAVIGQHVNTPPVAPSWHNSAIPASLDSLIMRLMAKDPAERPESADEVITALQAIDTSAAAQEEREASLDSMAGGVFVGRHREMDHLKALFEEVLSGHGRMATLVGEPGIGKTRTAQELATYAGMRGAQVLWGRSYEGGGAPPYWPWMQVLRAHVAAIPAEQLRTQLGATGPVLAEIVPDVREKLPDLPAPAPLEDPESARFRLFDSLATFLKNVSAGSPLVLMLEDLHWADRPSLMLLEFVARELANSKIMVVGNYRDVELNRRHPLSVTLGDLSRDRLFERILLRGLQRHDVERFIEIAAGIAPPAALVTAVHTQTEGNPLFVTETVRLLIQEGEIASGTAAGGGTSSWEIRIPEGVREVIGRRLDRLSERCNEVLTTAAVIGRQFRFGVLMRLVEDASENMLLDVLDEALSARIVQEMPEEVGLYQFTHASMQETLTSELSANRLVRLHARIAEALEGYYGDDAEEHAEELVEHFAEAEVVLGQKKLFTYALRAGERAVADFAYEQAIAYLSQAMSASTTASKEQDARVSGALALAQIGALGRGEIQAAVKNATRAFELYRELGSNAEATHAALTPFPYVHGTRGIAELLQSALEIVPEFSREAGLLNARIGTFASMESGDLSMAVGATGRALRIAEEIGDTQVELEALAFGMNTDALQCRVAEAQAKSKRALELVDYAESHVLRINIFELAGHLHLMHNGDVGRAIELYAEMLREATRIHHHLYTEWAVANFIRLYMLCGDWTRAESMMNEPPASTSTEFRILAQRIDLALSRGQLEEADELILAMDQHPGDLRTSGLLLPILRIRRSWIGGSQSYPKDELPTLLAAFEDTTQEMDGRIVAAVYALLLSSMNRDDKLSDRLLRFLSGSATSGIRYLNLGLDLQDRIIGVALSIRGDYAESEQRLQSVLRFAGRNGFRPTIAWVSADYSDLLLKRDAPGDREKAVGLQDEAIAIAQELGMKPLLERVLAQREILKA